MQTLLKDLMGSYGSFWYLIDQVLTIHKVLKEGDKSMPGPGPSTVTGTQPKN